jgi:hypothetical protein
MSNQNLKDNAELTEEEKQLLIEIIQNHIIKLYQEMRQNELVINNEPLRCQYSENYIVMLRGQNIDYRDRIKRLKLLVNKIFREEMYREDDLK